MTSPLPTLQYLVAFNNGPLDDPALITSVATPGTVGAANVWTDITASVLGHQLSRGRQHELSQFEAGTCTLDLDNHDGRFNPWNTSSPYTGLLKPKKLLQVRATWSGTTYKRFTGHINAWPVLWPDPVSTEAQVQATDAFRLFQAADITGTGYPMQVLSDGAVAYWRFNDPVGSTSVADLGPNALVGSVTSLPGFGGPDTVTFGQAGALVADPATSAQLGDTSGDVGNVNFSGSGLSSWTNATIEAWVEYNTSTAIVWVNAADPTGANCLYMQIGTALTANKITFGVQATAFVSNPTLVAGWHHFAVTKSGSTLTLYIDGVAQSSTISTGSPAPDAFVEGFVVGSATPMNVQDVAVYPTALSAATLANHVAIAEFVQERTDQRISHVLNTLGWSAGARALDTGISQVQAVTASLTQTSSLAHMQDCETTEAGAMFMSDAGVLTFLSRNTLWTNALYQTSQATFGDGAAEIEYDPAPSLGLDDINIYNEATGQRQNGNRLVVDNPTSITEYGRSTWQPNGTLLGTSDAEVLGRLQYVVNNYNEPVTRISSIAIDLLNAVGYDLKNSTNTVGSLLALDLLYRVTVNRHTMPGGGTAFQEVALIEKIDETVTADDWIITLSLDPADTSQQFVWGTSKWGQTTKWAF